MSFQITVRSTINVEGVSRIAQLLDQKAEEAKQLSQEYWEAFQQEVDQYLG